MPGKKRIAILFHEHHKREELSRYAITFLADYWRVDGHDVRFVFGVKKFIPADLALLHVDLSVLPEEYLEFAERYPIVLNGAAKDIRKSTFSRNLVNADDPYNGPVIVKSDLNYAGLPERAIYSSRLANLPERARKLLFGRRNTMLSFETPTDYQIYDHLNDVPRAYFKYNELVVEKFLPEKENDLYFVHNYEFLGDRATCTRLAARHRIVNDRTLISCSDVTPHPEITALRKEMKFDYGKFDYVIHGAKAILLDTNKTTGASAVWTPELEARRRRRADGIYSYFC
jgi:hypothetical protein